ncbi:MAG: Fe-S cluster assembly protein SufD [Phycisphaerales bacterium]|nr:Fe-S cluster assembly protein SufD [Phycisphaerales bacterium]
MNAAPVAQNPFRQQFKAFVASRREPDTITRRRREGFDRFIALGWPTHHQEAWRFTDLSALAQIDLQRPTNVPIDANVLPTLNAPAHRLSFVNGCFAPALSQLRGLPNQAIIASLGQALLTHPDWIEPYLEQLPGLSQHPFAALNAAFWEDGAFLHLPRAAVVEAPIHLIFYSIGDHIGVYPRLLLVLDEGAQATVVVEYRGEGRYLNAPVAELQLGAGAVLNYHQIQEESPQAFHLGGIRIHQQRDSQMNSHLVSFGGQLARVDLEALLDGEHIHSMLNGLSVVDHTQVSDHHLWVDHADPYGSSEQLFKSVLNGKARTVFDGMIHVRQHAQKTEARQLNRNLLLSRQAQANSNPRLEILADDVKCGHGSSTGLLDPDALFYLRARGIPVEQARALLVQAFAQDSLNRISLTPLRERLANSLAHYLALGCIEEQ